MSNFLKEKKSTTQTSRSFQSQNTYDRKTQENIAANTDLIKTCGVLNVEGEDHGLQSFSKKKASPDQQHDLILT